MSELSVSREVAVSPDELWRLITDLDRSPNVISAVASIERLDGGLEFGVGTRWRETRVVMGHETTDVLVVTDLDPGRSYTVETESLGADHRSVVTVEDAPGGSRLTITFGSDATGVVSRAVSSTVGRLFEGGARKALIRDLDDIASVAETDSGH